jgi:hypothetical protein
VADYDLSATIGRLEGSLSRMGESLDKQLGDLRQQIQLNQSETRQSFKEMDVRMRGVENQVIGFDVPGIKEDIKGLDIRLKVLETPPPPAWYDSTLMKSFIYPLVIGVMFGIGASFHLQDKIFTTASNTTGRAAH